jgi:putative tributyrin esterase
MTRGTRALLAAVLVVVVVAGVALWCRRLQPQRAYVDHPRLAPGVVLRDVTFYSRELGREMHYRVLLPEKPGNKKLPVVYLLHGGGGDYRDWTNYADTAKYAADLILVMPQGDDSYWTNSATRPMDRYEDYVINDLIADVEERFPAERRREARAIAGVSMGGYGAVKIALHDPDMFAFVGGLSPAIDVPRRAFSWKRIGQWRYHSSIFGPAGDPHRLANDPFVLIQGANGRVFPYFYLTCGSREGLLPSNREFANKLKATGAASEFHEVPGGHDWNQWNAQLPGMFVALHSSLRPAAPLR